jgi:transposase
MGRDGNKVIITMEDYKKIRHMFLVEGKSQRQIARTLGISRNTVAKYCNGNIYPGIRADYHRDASVVTPDVIRFILQCLQEDALEPNQKQHHTAKRIYDRLVTEMGFKGSESNIRRTVRILRGRSQDVYVPLSFAAGDAMQIDWGEAYAYIDGARTKLNVFCARLCYSCAPFAVCFHKQNTESFLEGLILAFEFFGGVVRRVLFDNAKVAVKKGAGRKAIPQESYAALATHYCFEPVFCNARSGNEKGLVENLVGWTRRNIFVPVPRVTCLAELNQRLSARCQDYIDIHRVSGRPAPVKDLLQTDKQELLPLPGRRFDTSDTTECRVSQYATVRYASNEYSVPVALAGRNVTVKAFAETIQVFKEAQLVATHERCYGKRQKCLQLAHYLPLLEKRPRSILQAKPVEQALSPDLLHLLKNTNFSAKELMEILRLCTEEGEKAFWRRKVEFLEHHARSGKIQDPVSVPTIDLSIYDQLIQKGDSPCKIQV